jgi:O-methyltransferase
MIPLDIYIANLELAKRFSSIKGAVVECGTWKGGMIAGIANLLGEGRSYYLFDSFEGLPAAKKIDGESAIRWQADKSSPDFYDNCRTSEKIAKRAMWLANIYNPEIRKGWFKDTLPKAKFPEGIAILRLDADWYEPTLSALEYLFKYVNKGGVIIMDDYLTWDGCSRAVHNYLARHKRREKIREYNNVIFIEKL